MQEDLEKILLLRLPLVHPLFALCEDYTRVMQWCRNAGQIKSHFRVALHHPSAQLCQMIRFEKLRAAASCISNGQ